MGAALSGFGSAFSATFKNPKYPAVVAVSVIAYFVLAGVSSLIPIIGQLVFFLLVVPALNAGIIGMAYAITEYGSAPLDAYLDSVTENLVSMAGAYFLSGIVQFILFIVLSIVMTIVTAVVGAGIVSQVSNPQQLANDPQALVGLLVAQGLVIFLVFLLWFFLLGIVFMLFQFVGPAIVVGGRSATSAIGKSVSVFTSNPLSVIGYTLLRGISFTIIVAIPFAIITAGGVQTATGDVNTTSPLVLVGGLLALVALPVAYAFFMMYHTTYYYQITDGDPGGGRGTPRDRGTPGGGGAPRGQGTPQYQEQSGSHQQGRGQPQYQEGQPNQYQGGGRQPSGGPQGRNQHQSREQRGGRGGQSHQQGGHGANQPQGGQSGQPQGGGRRDQPPTDDRADQPSAGDSEDQQMGGEEHEQSAESDDERYGEY